MMKISKNVCRACMDETATLVDLFAEIRDPTMDEPEMRLSHMLAQCTNRPVERGDLLPQYICLSCVMVAQNAFRFKWKCERSYQNFSGLLNKQCRLDQDPNQETQLQEDVALDSDQKETPQTKIQEIRESVQAESSSIPNLYRQPTSKEGHQNNISNANFVHKLDPANGTQKTGGDPNPMQSVNTRRRANKLQRQVRCDANGNYKCPHCPKRFYSQTQLRSHISELCHTCPYCPRAYSNRRNLRRHLLTHVSKPMHKCPHCSKAFMRSDHLKKHLLHTHDFEGPLSCSECSAVFIEGIHLEIHQREHLPKELSLESDSDVNSSSNTEIQKPKNGRTKKPTCHICIKTFCSNSSLKRHMIIHNRELVSR
ncbi:uncharacterized zinc finger protein CG2678 [Drosophila subpulchrella]|uniref:uncharacterized zinc finger protein CG2678 n=1 Tax=Drosophila subpulchrella TaxID=1486046 RepID=UPI0018A19E40|nr:uncharacterized zinc finger protein CG2678 [Drosophila subpulchrella]